MSILSKYYIDFGRLNTLHTTYERVGDQGLIYKIIDGEDWSKLDGGQKLLIFNSLRKLDILLPYKQENVKTKDFFYSNNDATEKVNELVKEEDFDDPSK
jgi:hypothetical protein